MTSFGLKPLVKILMPLLMASGYSKPKRMSVEEGVEAESGTSPPLDQMRVVRNKV